MSSLKYWLLGSFVLVLAVIFLNYSFLVHTASVDSTEKVDMSEGNMALGVFRGEVNDEGELNTQYNTLDIKEIEDNIISSVAVTQKGFRNDIKIIYTFLDKDGNEVDVSNEANHSKVRGVHYGVISLASNKTLGEENEEEGFRDVSISDRIEMQNIATEQEDYVPLSELLGE